ncbi:MAG TPA: ornithine carbamoyltransferase [Nitrososphaerales archaeon]|nr:ornithine carbamoyltransferase [Nitrososphaerales archaeon]
MKGKDFLTLTELTPRDLSTILAVAAKLKRGRASRLGEHALEGKTVALVFEKPSTRTRVSFQVAINELGGNPISLSSGELQLGRGETVEDTAHVLSRYVHCIMARVNRHSDLERLAKAATVPVINGLSDLHHPVQVLADLLTLQEHKGRLKGTKVAWVGDGDNVCNSWLYGAALTGIDFTAATPKGYEPLPEMVGHAIRLSKSTGAKITIVNDPRAAVKGADCVMTDTFVSMGQDQERKKREKAFLPKYQVDGALMSLAKRGAIFQHCLPAHRGDEVTPEVIDGPHSVVFDEAENRMHTEKALLCFLMLGSEGLSTLGAKRKGTPLGRPSLL